MLIIEQESRLSARTCSKRELQLSRSHCVISTQVSYDASYFFKGKLAQATSFRAKESDSALES